MLQAPVDYSINAANPMETGLAGFAMGQQMRGNEQNMRGEEQRQALLAQEGLRAETQFGQQNILFDQAQQDRLQAQEDALAAAEKEEALARQTLADKGALVELVRSGKAGAADFFEFSAKYPDIAEELKAPFDGYTAEQRKSTVFDLRRAGMALKSGKPEIAIQMLEDRAIAAENSGDPEQADMARATIEMLKTDPAAGQALLGLILQSVDEDAFKADYGDQAALPADVQSLQWRAKQAGLAEGTPEYKEFIGTGGSVPANFAALDKQAKAAGYEPGTPEYKNFMATRGEGEKEAA